MLTNQGQHRLATARRKKREVGAVASLYDDDDGNELDSESSSASSGDIEVLEPTTEIEAEENDVTNAKRQKTVHTNDVKEYRSDRPESDSQCIISYDAEYADGFDRKQTNRRKYVLSQPRAKKRTIEPTMHTPEQKLQIVQDYLHAKENKKTMKIGSAVGYIMNKYSVAGGTTIHRLELAKLVKQYQNALKSTTAMNAESATNVPNALVVDEGQIFTRHRSQKLGNSIVCDDMLDECRRIIRTEQAAGSDITRNFLLTRLNRALDECRVRGEHLDCRCRTITIGVVERIMKIMEKEDKQRQAPPREHAKFAAAASSGRGKPPVSVPVPVPMPVPMSSSISQCNGLLRRIFVAAHESYLMMSYQSSLPLTMQQQQLPYQKLTLHNTLQPLYAELEAFIKSIVVPENPAAAAGSMFNSINYNNMPMPTLLSLLKQLKQSSEELSSCDNSFHVVPAVAEYILQHALNLMSVIMRTCSPPLNLMYPTVRYC